VTKRKIGNNVGLTVSRSDLTGLRVFEAVARNRGFSAAQSELGLSQPSISNHLSALETRLGVRLCQRGGTGFELTEKGRTVLDAAQRLFAAMEAFTTDVDDLRDRIVGKIRIGVVDAIASDPSLGLRPRPGPAAPAPSRCQRCR
jgi:DNA-binding transcriptional LysR family regulator